MDYNNTYEQEIDLKELMFAVLHKWRIILALAVALALVLGGYKAVTSYMEQNDEETAQEAQEEYEKERNGTKVFKAENDKEYYRKQMDNALSVLLRIIFSALSISLSY